MKKKIKRVLSLLMAVAMLVNCVSCSACSKSKKSTPENKPESSQTMFKVEYALPEGTTAADAATIHLPKTEMVEKGTVINTLTTPAKDNSLFLGWYSDPALTEKVDNLSVVEKNLVLYPKFANQDGFEMEMMNNYIAARNVEPSFVIEIITDALSVKELSEYIKVTNLSKNQDAVFTITNNPEVNNSALSMDETLVSSDYKENALWDFLETYMSEEELEKTGIDRDDVSFTSVSDFKQALGLKEEDNLENYLMDELQMDITSVLELEELLGMYKEAQEISEVLTGHYFISAPLGWDAPDLFQAKILDTEHVRFIYEGQPTSEYVIYYNFTVKKTEIENMRVDSDVKFIRFSDVQGVDMNTTLYKLIGDDDGNVSQVDSNGRGTMKYSGNESFSVDDVLAVYDGILDETTKKVDGRVTYVKITGVNGNGQYDYITAEFSDVVFTPDIIPVQERGTYGSGRVTLTKNDTNFSYSLYGDMGLDDETVIEPGDFLAFYRGDLKNEQSLSLVGYALITKVTPNKSNYDIEYEVVTVEQMLTSADLYMVQDNIDIPMTQEEIDALETSMRTEAEESGFFTETADYLSNVIVGNDYEFANSENADVLKKMEFLTDTGEKLTLEEVQLMAAGGKVEVSKPKIQFSIGGKLEYLAADSGVTSGLRGELSASFEITINLNKNSAGVQNQIKINCTAILEQEIALGVTISCEVQWGWEAIFYVIQEFEIQLALVAGTYSGLGVTVTIQTTVKENDKEWGDLINASNQSFTKAGEETGKKAALNLKDIGQKCSDIKDKLDKFGGSGKSIDSDHNKESGAMEAGQSVGGSFQEKYSGMLDNDCDWCYLIDKQITKLSFRPDPFQLIELSLGLNFIVKFKLNCMIGFGVSYENVKQLSYTIYVNEQKTESSNADLKTPAFRADFYVFGMAGLRVGFKLDARVGLLSTKLDSVGVVAELGLFLEIYGFLYIHYSWVSGEGVSKGIMGSLYFRIGLFLEISFLAQLGDGKLSYSKDLFKIEWPFFEAGAKAFPLGFAEKDTLELKIPKGESKVTVPKEFFDIEMMTLTDGETSNENSDSDEIGSKGDSVTIDGVPYTQYNEKNFIVTVSNPAFSYLPASDTVYVRSAGNALSMETDITFTYVLQTFGFNTEEIKRSVHVTWEADPSVISIEYYTKEKDGSVNLRETKELSGYDGLYYDFLMNQYEIYKYDNYRLFDVEFPSLPEKINGVEKLKEQLRDVEANLSKENLPDEEKISLEAQKLKLTAECAAAQVVINEYQSNIDRIMNGEKGWLTFPIVGENTKIKFYYVQPEHKVRWYIPSNVSHSDYKYVVKNISGKRGETTMTYKDLLSDYINGISYEKKDGYEFVWRKLKTAKLSTGDAFYNSSAYEVPKFMPDQDIAFVGFYVPVDYSVTFEDEGVELTSYRAEYGAQIADLDYVPPVTNPISTEFPDGTVQVTFGSATLMADPSMSAAPSMFGKEVNSEVAVNLNRTISFGDALSMLNAAASTGSSSSEMGNGNLEGMKSKADRQAFSAPKAPEKENLEFDYWIIDGSEKLTNDSTMPGHDIVITPVYKGKLYTISWVSEGKIVKNEKVRFKDAINPPTDIRNAEGIDAIWSVNGQEFIKGMTMPAADLTITASYPDHVHQWEKEDTAAANCTTEGMIKYVCELCKETKTEILRIDPNNHVHKNLKNQKESTESEDGYTGDLYCDDCGNLLQKGTVVPKKHTHSYDDSDVIKEANCKESGLIIYTCICGDTKTEVISVDPSIHLHTSVRNEKAVSGLTDGYTGDVYCDDCGILLEKGTVIMHDHVYDAGVVKKEANCKEEGLKVYTCGCGATKNEVISVDPSVHLHTSVRDERPVSDSTYGYTGDLYCDDCGMLLRPGTVITHEHTYDAGVVRREANCKEEGLKVYTCSCGATKSERISVDPLKHLHTEEREEVAATLSTPGSSGVYCKDCENRISDGNVTYVSHTVRVGLFTLNLLNDTDYDYYDKTLGFFNHLYGNDRTCTVNVFDSPDFAGEGDPENVVMVLSGNTIVTGTYAFDEQDLLVKDMTPRSYWATFTPDEEFAGVGSFRFTVPFVRK